MKFEEDPDYTYLRSLFKSIMEKNNFKNDLQFDWLIKNNKISDKEENLKKDTINKEDKIISQNTSNTNGDNLPTTNNLNIVDISNTLKLEATTENNNPDLGNTVNDQKITVIDSNDTATTSRDVLMNNIINSNTENNLINSKGLKKARSLTNLNQNSLRKKNSSTTEQTTINTNTNKNGDNNFGLNNPLYPKTSVSATKSNRKSPFDFNYNSQNPKSEIDYGYNINQIKCSDGIISGNNDLGQKSNKNSPSNQLINSKID